MEAQRLRLFFIPVILFLASSANATLFMDSDGFYPYVGTEAQLRYLPFGRDKGANVFKKRFPQGNVFAGIKWNDCLGLEAGYEVTTKTHRSVSLTENQMVFGFPGNQIHTRDSTAQIYGPHLNLMGYWSLCDCSKTQFIGSIGLAYLKARLSSDIITEVDPASGLLHNVAGTDISSFSQSKFIARAGGGLQYFINDCVAIRSMIILENTQQFKLMANNNPNFPSDSAKLKNSFIFSFGILFNF